MLLDRPSTPHFPSSKPQSLTQKTDRSPSAPQHSSSEGECSSLSLYLDQFSSAAQNDRSLLFPIEMPPD
jgi:hypothetical protein